MVMPATSVASTREMAREPVSENLVRVRVKVRVRVRVRVRG